MLIGLALARLQGERRRPPAQQKAASILRPAGSLQVCHGDGSSSDIGLASGGAGLAGAVEGAAAGAAACFFPGLAPEALTVQARTKQVAIEAERMTRFMGWESLARLGRTLA